MSKHILENIVTQALEKAPHLNLWQSTQQAINWFKELPKDKKLSYIRYDIEGYYPSVTEETLDKALDLAKTFVHISDNDIHIIKTARENFVIHNGQPWKRKKTNGFDVTMGSWDSCQVTDLIVLYLLWGISKIVPLHLNGVYRDDGMIAVPGRGQKLNQIRKKLDDFLGKTISALKQG